MAVHGVEVPGAGETVPPVHCALGREPLAAPSPAALEDRAAGTRRHARTESVLALSSAHVGLVGPLHGLRGEKKRNERPFSGAPFEYRRARPAPVFHRCHGPQRCCETRLSAPVRPALSTPVDTAVGEKEIPAKTVFFTHWCPALSTYEDTGMLAARSPLERSRRPATWSAVNY
jgi:hypothetical protein